MAESGTSALERATGALRSRVDEVLDAFLSSHRLALAGSDPDALPLVDELRSLVRAGGKRLRPLFCYWGNRASGADDSEEIVRACASLELLHTFAIIHDDVMDRSAVRRGRPSSHIALARPGDAHFGVAAAILAGDLALALADDLFAASGFPTDVLAMGIELYNRMRIEVVYGQYLDVAATRSRGVEEHAVRRIAAMKSGSYTVEKPLAIGASLAHAGPDVRGALSAYGMPLGEAFQLRDDVLGVFGRPDVTGKDVDGDLREGKRTLLVVRALAAASEPERDFLESRLGREDLAFEDAEKIRDIMRSTGALASTLRLIDQLREQAVAALDRAVLPALAAGALTELADLAAARES